ncbi:bifunctional protein-serine/threonine kinase/phosphatase [Neptuniibacter caesariensis]|uniref:Protein kinase:Protein phosphatase 2C-like n=1 Tax=Neptuniibacter caesariensis TaxID=207954 RepID=A0A7U8CA79_NEPCE|nr:bifunctional protein-serine/threonine kinase/phosphatase [Neptuniibacter caesariensis]EAR63009.1 Protein kinase:Protein phosphatase 2C-like [Oceanospirillum sp. MED92] [Neptuniibacter caesariensis]
MRKQLKISTGQYSDKGVKPLNQDFHGAIVPKEPQLSLKGVALALADGISSSDVSQIASETAVKNFLEDFYSTSDAWTVQRSGERVLEAINGWLYSQTQRSEYRLNKDKGYVCTLSALVFKARIAHLFHIGDSRIYRLREGGIEQLTKDHRVWKSKDESYLSRALGVSLDLDLDYQQQHLKEGDIYLLCTDGVYEFSETQFVLDTLEACKNNLDEAAKLIVHQALNEGSADNLTLQIARVEQLPQALESSLKQQVDQLALPPILYARDEIDGYRILRELHANSRSRVYLAEDIESQAQVILKTPSVDMSDDPAYLERFLMEEWVARRISSAHVMKAAKQDRQRNYLYTVMEHIEGQTLAQWLRDTPNPDLETTRNIVEQIAHGLQAMHRKEILHQDMRPENIMIDTTGTVKIIDFGAVLVAGIVEAENTLEQPDMQGTALYMAPEYFVGEVISRRADFYSLAVITYHMLSGRFPYGTNMAKARTTAAQHRLKYRSVLDDERELPAWVDETLRKALQPNVYKRYAELSEFIYDLRHPNASFIGRSRPPLIERNPLFFWKSLSFGLAITVAGLLAYIQTHL